MSDGLNLDGFATVKPSEIPTGSLWYMDFADGYTMITGATSNAAATPLTTAGTVNNVDFNQNATGGRGYDDPELQPNSGHILYVENRRPISRASDQTEDIKIVVEF